MLTIDKLAALIESKAIDKTEISKSTGMSYRTLVNKLERRTELKENEIEKITAAIEAKIIELKEAIS